jgi:hypothetical protein
MGQTKQFCVMTHGRSGSTWLINSLAELEGVRVPAHNVQSNDNELLKRGMTEQYAALVGRPLDAQDQLVQAFFHLNRDARFAGFKSMPERHTDYRAFAQRTDLRFITLDRRDVHSTAASFLLAHKQGTWRRAGGVPSERCTFTQKDVKWVGSNLAYIFSSRVLLGNLVGAIQLSYEDLCQEGFQSPELDAFFERPVRLTGAKAPTSGKDYITNWDQFVQFIDHGLSQLNAQLEAKRAAQSGQPAFVALPE